MDHPRSLHAPQNEVEAQTLMAFLEEEGIECVELRKRDSAYPGVADFGRWGVILVDERDLERAERVLADMLEAMANADEIDEEALAQEALSHERE